MPTPTDHAAAEHLRAALTALDDTTGRYLLDADTLDDVATLYGLDAETVSSLRHLMTTNDALLGVLAEAGTTPDTDCAATYRQTVAMVATLRAAFHIPTYEEYVMHTRMAPPPACVLR